MPDQRQVDVVKARNQLKRSAAIAFDKPAVMRLTAMADMPEISQTVSTYALYVIYEIGLG